MKLKFYIAAVSLCFSLSVQAQKDSRAREVLEKTESAYLHTSGVMAEFKGSNTGTICLMDDKFHLNSGGIETWFDGQTQWSYVKQNEEVNVSEPTQEELQSINPYALLSLYKQGYNYTYAGKKKVNGKLGTEIVLTPEVKGNVASIHIVVDASFHPLSLQILGSGGEENEFIITSYKTQQNFSANEFVFPSKKYPEADVIDLR